MKGLIHLWLIPLNYNKCVLYLIVSDFNVMHINTHWGNGKTQDQTLTKKSSLSQNNGIKQNNRLKLEEHYT